MNDANGQVNKKIRNISRWLMAGFLLLAASICLADEPIPEPGSATDIYHQGDIGVPNDGRVKQKPSLEDLGEQEYRIGSIKVDKAKRQIRVPGVMLGYEENKPIEFIATMQQGYKSYESVLMLDANAFEFNLACILIGLDSAQSVSPRYHFDPRPIKGDPVSIRVAWEKDGRKLEYDVVELLKTGETKPATPSVWSYTGSSFIEGDRYLAQMDGVLIGLIHDPASIIEHSEGLGVGNWGSVTIDPAIAPQNGQALVLTIQGLN